MNYKAGMSNVTDYMHVAPICDKDWHFSQALCTTPETLGTKELTRHVSHLFMTALTAVTTLVTAVTAGFRDHGWPLSGLLTQRLGA